MSKPTARTDITGLRQVIRALRSENAALRGDPFAALRTPPETPERVAIFRKIAKMAREFTKRNPEFEEFEELQSLVNESFSRMQDERYPAAAALRRADGRSA